MQNCVSKFIESRIEEISQALRKGNGRYALAAESSKLLYDSLEPIVQNEGDISISAGDCLNFREYFEQEFEATAIMQKELYRQGYLDVKRPEGRFPAARLKICRERHLHRPA